MLNQQPKLKRELGLFSAISIVGGVMIGSGIFYVGSFVLERSGLSQGFAIIAWIIAGVMSLMAGLCYAELGTSFPKEGGAYVYISEAYGHSIGFTMGWTDFLIVHTGSISAMAIGFGTYLSAIIPLNQLYIKLVAISMIILLTVINIVGIKSGARIQSIFMVAKLIPIILIIVLGFSMGKAENPITFMPGQGKGFFSAFAFSVVAALWAFDGWNTVYIVSEELKNPEKDLPKAIIYGIAGVTIVYVLFNMALFKVLPPDVIATEAKPAALAASTLIGNTGILLVSIGALLAIFGSCNGCLLAYPREYYAMARDKRFFKAFAKLSPKYGTPVYAQIATATVSIVLIILGSFEQLTTLTVFSAWIFYTLGVSSVIILRKKYPDISRPYKVWGYPYIPIISILLSIIILGATLYQDPISSLTGLIVPFIGFIVYHLYFKKQ